MVPSHALTHRISDESAQASGAAQNASPSGATDSAVRPELVIQAGHTKAINTFAFSPDERWIATAGQDLTVKIWDLSSGNVLRTIACKSRPFSIAVSPDSRTLATGAGSDNRMDLNFAPGAFAVQLWDVATGKELKTFGTHAYSVQGLAFTPDGYRLVSVSGDAIKVWYLNTGRILHSETIEYGKFKEAYASLASAIVSPDGELAAVAAYGKPYQIYETVSGREVSDSKVKADFYTSAAFSPDGKLIAFLQKGNTIVKPSHGGAETRTFDTGQAEPGTRGSIHFSPDGQTVLVSRQKKAGYAICDLSSAKCASSPPKTSGDSGSIFSIFSPDGHRIAAQFGSELRITDALSGREEQVLSSQEAIPIEETDVFRAYMSNPRVVESFKKTLGLNTPEEIKAFAISHPLLLEQATLPTSQYLPKNLKSGESLAFTSDGRWLVTRYKSMQAVRIEAWNTSTGTPVHNLDPAMFSSVGVEGASADGRFTAAAVNPSASFAAAFLGRHQPNPNKDPYINQPKVALSDAHTGRTLHTFDLGKTDDRSFTPTIAFSSDGNQIAMTGFNNTHDQVLFFYETVSGAKVGEFGVPAQLSLRQLAISPASGVVALAADSQVELLDIASNRVLRVLPVSQGVRCFAFNLDGSLLAILDAAGNKEIWSTRSGEKLATLVNIVGGLGGASKEWLVVSPDGLFDGSPGAYSHILWRFSGDTFDVAPVELFFSDFYYPGLLAEVFNGKAPKPSQTLSQVDRRQPHVSLKAGATTTAVLSNRLAELEVQVADAPGGANDVRLFRNGSLVKQWHGDVLKGAPAVTLSATVPILAGANRFTAYAFNNGNIKSADASLTLVGAESLRRPSTAYVLVVGINTYANADYDLKFAVNDAHSFAEEFRQHQANLGRYSQVKVVSLLDKDATKANILLALSKLSGSPAAAAASTPPAGIDTLSPAQPEDAVILYYAGHGTARRSHFYLIPHDLGYNGSRLELTAAAMGSILEHSISDQELTSALEDVDAGQLLLVIDACNSGQALEAEEKRRGPMNSKGLAQLAYEKGIDILTAAQSYQTALEAQQLGHGYLTYALVEEGLKTAVADTAPKDGQVDVREWLDFASERVPQMQESEVQRSRQLGREISFSSDSAPGGNADLKVQRPRVFYRREVQYPLFIVAKP